MKKSVILLMLLSFTLGVQAQLLWKISGKDLPQSSYIFGSHHVAPMSILDSIPGIKQAMSETKQLYGEIIMEDMMKPAVMEKMQKAMILPGDTTLSLLYSESRFDSISAVFKNMMGVDLVMLDKMSPIALSTQLSVILSMKYMKGYNPKEQLDTWFQKKAKENGKKLGSLETVDEQIKLLYQSLTLERQAEMLYYMVANIDQAEKITKELGEAYMKQDLVDLMELTEAKTNTPYDSTPEELDLLVYNRNVNWSKKMPDIMKETPTFFVVGAGHLAGDKGVLNLLKQLGYTLEPIR